MDVSRVRSVGELLNQETSRQLLTAGQQWQGTAWNTSKASKVLYSLTGVPIVRGVWQEYRNAFLYALSLYLEVEILELDLSDRVADVAFSLAQVFSSPVGSAEDWYPGGFGSTPAGGTFLPSDTAEPSEEDEVQISWDEPQQDLPLELAYLWANTVNGERRLDLKSVLNQVPRFKQLPRQAPLNNHRFDGNAKHDKKEKAWQQTVLHSVRLLSAVYVRLAGQEAQLLQQLFQLLTELYLKIEQSRKEASVPGSVGPAGEVLFDKQELQSAMQMKRINRMGRGNHLIKNNVAYDRLFSSTGRGFGKGWQPGYGSQWPRGKGMKPFYRRPYMMSKGGKGGNRMEPDLPLNRNDAAHDMALKAKVEEEQTDEEPEGFLQDFEKSCGVVETVCPTHKFWN